MPVYKPRRGMLSQSGCGARPRCVGKWVSPTTNEGSARVSGDEYGGKGIVVGWETSEAEWERALAEALQSPFVVQERVTIAYEDYPALVDGQVQIGRRLVDSDPFMFGDSVQGCLSRLSTVTLLNVTAGGGSTVPVFVIDAA